MQQHDHSHHIYSSHFASGADTHYTPAEPTAGSSCRLCRSDCHSETCIAYACLQSLLLIAAPRTNIKRPNLLNSSFPWFVLMYS
jgi:hypothetical protein